jgi:hypothetical protein
MRKILFFIIFLLTLTTCKKKINQNIFEQITVSVDSEHALREINASSVFSDIEYVQLESPDDHLIGEISQILFHKERFYILDSEFTKSIFCFRRDGKFLFEINRIGNGPGEYIEPQSISINHDKDLLMLYCSATHQVISFDLEGIYLQTQKLDFYATHFAYMAENRFAFSVDYNGSNTRLLNNRQFPGLIITNSDFKIESTGLPFSETINFSAITQLSCCFSPLPGNGLSMIIPCNDTVYHLRKDKIERAYYIDFGKKKKTENFYRLMNDEKTGLGDLREYLYDNDICDIFHLVESEQNLFFIYMHGKSAHLAFYDKAEDKLTDVYLHLDGDKPQYPIINDLDGGPFSVPYFSDGKFFYGYILPETLLEKRESIESAGNPESPGKEKLLSILNRISGDDNPVISIITPK